MFEPRSNMAQSGTKLPKLALNVNDGISMQIDIDLSQAWAENMK